MFKKTITAPLYFFLSIALACAQTPFVDKFEFVGVAISEPGYHIWGTSPVWGEDGKVHLFVARWPEQYQVNPGWRSHSEIAHYVGDSPEGPFQFSEVALKGTGTDTWDKFAPHNPHIQKIGHQYVLLYIANDNPNQPPHPSNQNIGMATADSPYGPWTKVNEGMPLLTPPDNGSYWNYQAKNGVVNPALLVYKGAYYLYFKSQNSKMGLAIAEKLEGPYVQMPFPVTDNDKTIEDGYAFMYEGDICLLTTDNHGTIKTGGGILWRSKNGIQFERYEAGFNLINEYPDAKITNPKWYYGPKDRIKFERPQMLLKEGKPQYLYLASGCNIYGGKSTVSYILKFKDH